MNAAGRLLVITAEYSDDLVARMIANKMIVYSRSDVFRYKINHDISPPKCLACPVPYHWSTRGFVGVEFKNVGETRTWLTNAALAGYEIEEITSLRRSAGGRIESIEKARMRAAFHQRPKWTPDDDIPF